MAYTKALVGDDSVYGVRMPIGLPDVIKGVGGAALREFYTRYCKMVILSRFACYPSR